MALNMTATKFSYKQYAKRKLEAEHSHKLFYINSRNLIHPFMILAVAARYAPPNHLHQEYLPDNKNSLHIHTSFSIHH